MLFFFFICQAKLVLEWLSNVSQPAVDRRYVFDSISEMVFIVIYFLNLQGRHSDSFIVIKQTTFILRRAMVRCNTLTVP